MAPDRDPEEMLDLFSSAPEEAQEAIPEGPKVWTVSEINAEVAAFIGNRFDALWVTGEVTNWTRARSGHCYFTLKDQQAQLRCVLWRRDAARVPLDPEEGMGLRVFGRLALYEARGDFQLVASQVEAEGEEGLWKLAFERLKKKLLQEGLLDRARKRPIPRYPTTIGVVTSATGAAVRDILRVVGRRAPWVRVIVRGTRVQGEGASELIAQAMDDLASLGRCEVIIVGRGGGSIEDLWAFNEEPLARAIARCPVPVISAVGHETDTTISDLVADLRAATPSAAAEAAVPDKEMVLALLRKIAPRLSRALRSGVERRSTRLRDVLRPRLLRGMERVLEPRRRTLDRAWERMSRALQGRLRDSRADLRSLGGQLHALSPLQTLSRGYAVAQDEEGRVLRGVSDFEEQAAFRLRVVDGTVHGRVEGVEPLDDAQSGGTT
jgi:exodeoxyribonuclease VII large subunit